MHRHTKIIPQKRGKAPYLVFQKNSYVFYIFAWRLLPFIYQCVGRNTGMPFVQFPQEPDKSTYLVLRLSPSVLYVTFFLFSCLYFIHTHILKRLLRLPVAPVDIYRYLIESYAAEKKLVINVVVRQRINWTSVHVYDMHIYNRHDRSSSSSVTSTGIQVYNYSGILMLLQREPDIILLGHNPPP